MAGAEGGAVAALAVVAATVTLAAAPERRAASWPEWWLPQALCIHRHEGRWDDRRNPAFRGGMQFSWSTWRAVGGRGDPADASRREQLERAYRWWRRLGRWGTTAGWPRSSIACGLV